MLRKIFCVALCALALIMGRPLGVGPALVARAEQDNAVAAQAKQPRDTLSVYAVISPDSMAVPTEAQVYITLVNGSTEPISDITITSGDGSVTEDIGDLSENGSSYEFKQKLTPTSKQLRAGGIDYDIYYTVDKGKDTEERRKITEIAHIERLQAEPALEFTRTPSSIYAQSGDEVIITYRIKNTGNVPLTNVVVKDELCGEIGRIDSLNPGKKQRFTSSVTISENAESIPVVSYTYQGHDEKLTKKLDPITIYKADERLEARLEADQSAVLPGGVVNLQLKITNKGNVSYDKLEIKEEALGSLGLISTELMPGDSYAFAKRINIKSTTTFQFTVNGNSGSDSPVTTFSNMLTVAVTPPVDSINLQLTAEADNTRLVGPGAVNFTVRIRNEGEMDIRNVMLSERGRGEIKNLAVVALGDTAVPVQYQVDSDETFSFIATLTDAKGDIMSVMSLPVKIEIAQTGGAVVAQAPSQTASILGQADAAYHMDEGDGTFHRMVGMVLVLLGVLVVMLVISSLVRYNRRMRQKRMLIKRIRRGRRDTHMPEHTTARHANTRIDGNTGVYRKSDLIPRKETT